MGGITVWLVIPTAEYGADCYQPDKIDLLATLYLITCGQV